MSAYIDNNDVDNVSITRDGQGKLKTLFTRLDPNGNIGMYNSAGVEVAYLNSGGGIVFTGNGWGPLANSSVGIAQDAFNNFNVNVGPGSSIGLYIDGLGLLRYSGTRFSYVFGLATDGLGLPPIYAENDLTGQTAAVPSVCSFTPVANGSFEVGGYLILNSISGGTSPNISMSVDWTDTEGYVQGFWLTGDVSHNSTGQSNFQTTASLAKDFLSCNTKTIRVKANTAIVISALVNGSPTSVNYDVGAHIKQIA